MRIPIRSQPTAPDWSRMSILFMLGGIPLAFTSKLAQRITRALLSVAVGVGVALLSAEAATAHLTPEPAFLAVGSKQRIVLTVHNDRDAEMTGFRLTVPAGFRILGTGGDGSWNESVDGAAASWTEGSLEAFRPATFEVDLEAAGVEPGPVVLRGDQLYADHGTVSWPVALTIVPAGGSPPGEDGLGAAAIAVLAVLGALVIASFALVFWQRRGSRLQER
jgi:hypothetical protein